MVRLTVVAFVLFATAAALVPGVPPATVIPIMLSTSLDAKKDTSGKKLQGSVMQDVALPLGKINKGARVSGSIVGVTNFGTSGWEMVLKFDAIEDEGHKIPLTARLLAVASMRSVAEAQSPINLSADRDPASEWSTRQVGGDIVRRGWGKVGTAGGATGTWVEGNSVLIRLTPNPRAGCAEASGYDRDQAVWVFSSGACGAYGLQDLKIASSGASAPLGQIRLTSAKNVVIQGGSGWLLMTVEPVVNP